MIEENIEKLKRMNVVKRLSKLMQFFVIIGGTLSLWNLGKVYLNVESPIVVVLTGSMEPAFIRGDLILNVHLTKINVGDIASYKVYNFPIPIVH